MSKQRKITVSTDTRNDDPIQPRVESAIIKRQQSHFRRITRRSIELIQEKRNPLAPEEERENIARVADYIQFTKKPRKEKPLKVPEREGVLVIPRRRKTPRLAIEKAKKLEREGRLLSVLLQRLRNS